MEPTFAYPDPLVDASKLAYDLALIYAHAKFEDALRTDPEESFHNGPALAWVEEVEFVRDKFMLAYGYYMGTEPGDLERGLKDLSI